mmetsp:Transcript_102505/g.330756  ORF Transcript_102505/g.330756 Transcript_102505/m.330756 type:complete len:273 (+) Transcript_102505:2273-3091(+)
MARRATSSGTTAGTRTSTPCSRTACAALAWFAASRRKSSSFHVTLQSMLTMGRGSGKPSGSQRAISQANTPAARRSCRKRCSTPLCWTLTTISRGATAPGASQAARWTWATDAEPSGGVCGSIVRRAATEAPNSSRTVVRTSSIGIRGMRSRSFESSFRYGAGRAAFTENCCPNFVQKPPSVEICSKRNRASTLWHACHSASASFSSRPQLRIRCRVHRSFSHITNAVQKMCTFRVTLDLGKNRSAMTLAAQAAKAAEHHRRSATPIKTWTS